MKQMLAKYFWGLNDRAIAQTRKILRNPSDPRFVHKAIVLFSRCQEPKEAFSFVPKSTFIEYWPRIRAQWNNFSQQKDFRDWWESIYEGMIDSLTVKRKPAKEMRPAVFRKIGKAIREARIVKGMSQNDLAIRTGIRQPDISKIEEGKKNITLVSLYRISKVLEIKNIGLQ